MATIKSLSKFLLVVFSLAIVFSSSPAAAKKKPDPHAATPRIVFVPHDNRPISDKQTRQVIEKMGWEIVTPPTEILGGSSKVGDPEKVWQWLESESETAHVAVLSTDTLLYGSLVGSRIHSWSASDVSRRVERLASFKQEHPFLKIYAFGSIMRTPRSAEASGGQEPGYYAKYGSDIFRYTALADKNEVEGLTHREKKEYDFLHKLIPQDAIDDWMSRRSKNFNASKRLIDLARKGTFSYLVLGRDDNAPYSQTHMESRKLSEAGRDLGASKFQAIAGIDELGLLMLTRSVNDWTSSVPFVFVKYNWGRGGNTVPAYSDEKIDDSIKEHVTAAGGLIVKDAGKADVVLCVNTNPNGKTYEAGDRANDGKPREGTKYFADIVQEYVDAGRPTCVADIAYANGSDNALMEMLKDRDLLFKLRAYAGWNTATNSTGFVMAEGMLAEHMTLDACDELLLRRYLDEWAYQANVRGIVARQLGWFRASGSYSALNERRGAAEERATRLMQRFCETNLPPFDELQYLKVTFPWNRMFEFDMTFDRPFSYEEYKARLKEK